MNKLEGLYELKNLKIPSIDWKRYRRGTKLDDRLLWTVRTAVFSENDLSLPKSFGQTADVSQEFADRMLEEMGERGIVIYYPYLLAEKSGTLQFSDSRIVVEAVAGDLGNLLSGSRVDVTYRWEENACRAAGSAEFLDSSDREELLSHAAYLRRRYAALLRMGNELQLEFSFAYDCSRQGERVGARRLVFFEVRTV